MQKNGIKWFPFFSRTGSEIADIIEETGLEPVKIFTNRKSLDSIDERLKKFEIVQFSKFEELDSSLVELNSGVVTLHGFLRIVPEKYITKNMFNGHPGAILKYPELKGFNPQEKAYSLKLPTSGSIIHRVIPEVDSGEVLYYNEVSIKDISLDGVYAILKRCSLDLWIDFFNDLENGKVIND